MTKGNLVVIVVCTGIILLLIVAVLWAFPGLVDRGVAAKLAAMPTWTPQVEQVQVVVTATPGPTNTPTAAPTSMPTSMPTAVPTNTPTNVPTATPTKVTPADRCQGPTLKLDFSKDPRSNPAVQLVRFGQDQKNLYEASQLKVQDVLGCGGVVSVLFQDWEPVAGTKDWKQVGADQALGLTGGDDVNLQRFQFPGSAVEYSDHGQAALVPFGFCLELWQNDDDTPNGGRNTGWQAGVCNLGAFTTAAPTTAAQTVCTGTAKEIDFSRDPRGAANQILRMPDGVHNIYNASRIRLYPNPSVGGCTKPVKVLFQQWCRGADCSGNDGKPWLEWATELSVGDHNLQEMYYPGTTIMVNDNGQKMWLWPKQCAILDENDDNTQGWQVIFCN